MNDRVKADLENILNAYKVAKHLGALFQCPFCGKHVSPEELHFEDELCQVLTDHARNSAP